MPAPMTYGDISPRTAAHAVAKMLTRGVPHLVIEKFGQVYVMPNRATKVAKFRRYNALPLALTPLVEGVTPAGSRVTVTDVTATLEQHGDFVPFSDVIEDTHEDPFLQQLTEVLGEQAAQTVETLRYNKLKAGTNVFFANGSQRSDVNTPLTLDLQRQVTRALKRQNAMQITSVVGSTPAFRTEPVEAAFIGLVHPDVENDIRNITGFIPTKQYGTVTPWANEIGAVEDVRYLRSTIFTSFPDAGGATSTMVSTTGTNADVYPVLYLAKDAYGIVPLKGKDSLAIMVVNPKPAAGDPLAQRGTAGWKTMQTSVILNDAWMVRAEVAATN
jgi:N4-gp56 family major capsid protein